MSSSVESSVRCSAQQPKSRRSLYGQQPWVKCREVPSLCQAVSFPLFTFPFCGGRSCARHSAWNLKHVTSFCASFLHKQKESAACVVRVGGLSCQPKSLRCQQLACQRQCMCVIFLGVTLVHEVKAVLSDAPLWQNSHIFETES